MKFLKISLLLLFIISCKDGVKFDANWHHANSEMCALIPEKGPIAYCGEEYFGEFACLHKTKIEELKEILDRAVIDKDSKAKISKILASGI